VTAGGIFEYMDGAGELYLGYRFDRLDVYAYRAASRPDILAEVYRMETPDDAFGLLSLDWGGEAVDSAMGWTPLPAEGTTARPRALYGEGLLRLCAGRVYARILAERETPESRKAVLDLGRAVVSGLERTPAPELFSTLPEALTEGWILRRDSVAYFRSHLVLNSIYYVSAENLFDLGLETEAVTAVYAGSRGGPDAAQRLRWLRIRYPDRRRAQAAQKHFFEVFLPEYSPPETSPEGAPSVGIVPLEEGWLGYKADGITLDILFDGPDGETVRTLLDGIFERGPGPVS
jgi:hypothetical protein